MSIVITQRTQNPVNFTPPADAFFERLPSPQGEGGQWIPLQGSASLSLPLP